MVHALRLQCQSHGICVIISLCYRHSPSEVVQGPSQDHLRVRNFNGGLHTCSPLDSKDKVRAIYERCTIYKNTLLGVRQEYELLLNTP